MGEHVLILAVGVAALAAVFVVARLDASYVVSGGLALTVFSGNWGNLGAPVGLDRFIVLAGVALAIRQNPRGALDVIRPGRVQMVMLGLVLYALVSAAFTGTLTQKVSVFALLDQLGIVPFILFVTAPVVFATPRQRAVLVGSLVIVGAYLSCTAVAETVGARGLVVPSYINNPALGIHYGRARGPFLEASANGGAIVSCATAAVLWLVLAKRSVPQRIAIGTLLVVAVIGLIGTLTRQVWVSAAATVLIVMIAAPAARRYLLPAAGAAALLTVGALAVIPNLRTHVTSRTEDKQPIWDRYNSNRAASRMAERRPILGFGWGSFPKDSPDFYVQSPTYPVSAVAELHNAPLSLLAELGAVGLVAWLAAVFLAGWGAFSRRGPPELTAWQFSLIGVGLNWIVLLNFTPLRYAFANYIVWTWAGVVAGLASGTDTVPRRRPSILPARSSRQLVAGL